MISRARLADRRVRAIRRLNAHNIRLLHLADVVAIYALLMAITGIMVAVRSDFDAGTHVGRYLWSYALIALLHLAVFYFGGLYDRERRLGSRPSLPRIVLLAWIASLLAGLASWLLGEFLVPRTVLVAFAVIAPIILTLNRRLSRWLRLRATGPTRVLLVGDDAAVKLAMQHLPDAKDPVVVAGTAPDAATLERDVERTRASGVLLLDGNLLRDLYGTSLARLEKADVETLAVVGARESLLGLRSVTEIGGMPFVGLSSHVLPPSQARLKRYLDLAIITVSLPITLPLSVLVSAYVAATAGRPLLFVQPRVGRDGEPFPMLKFRSMRPDAEAATGPVQATANDARIVPGMTWVRQSRLDELPQLWNVLRGQMSIVGPRPERPTEMEYHDAIIPGYRQRYQIPPGITGLAQVYGYAHTDPEYKLGHDLHYLANWSPILDLQIMVRTAWVIVSRRG